MGTGLMNRTTWVILAIFSLSYSPAKAQILSPYFEMQVGYTQTQDLKGQTSPSTNGFNVSARLTGTSAVA